MTWEKSQPIKSPRGSVMCVCEILGHVPGCSCVCRDVKLLAMFAASVFIIKGCVVLCSVLFTILLLRYSV